MPDQLPEKSVLLKVSEENDEERLCKICHALSVPARVQIMRILLKQNKSLSDISKELNMPISSVARHIDTLLDAQLIFVNYQPGLKGHTKYCAQAILNLGISLSDIGPEEIVEPEMSVEMPIGMFSHCHITPPCGMLSSDGPIGEFDDPRVFFTPERINAQCLWFNMGSISYNFPTTVLSHKSRSEISFTFEICSETSYFNNNWPSDITVSVNKTEIVTFTSPGDFGGRRGKFTPKFWPITSTQFGIMKKLTINGNGAYLDNALVNPAVNFDSLDLYKGHTIQLTLNIKEDAKHRGGMNLFGAGFGDFPQHIIMSVR